MHKMQMHAGAISKLLYGFASVREIIHLLKLADYLPVRTHKLSACICCLAELVVKISDRKLCIHLFSERGLYDLYYHCSLVGAIWAKQRSHQFNRIVFM